MSQKTKFQYKNDTEKWTCAHAYIWTRVFCVLFTDLSQQIHLVWTQIYKQQLNMEGGFISLHGFHTSFLLLTPDMTAHPARFSFWTPVHLLPLCFYTLHCPFWASNNDLFFFWQWIFPMNFAYHSVRVRLDISENPQHLNWQTKDQWGLTKLKTKSEILTHWVL